MHTQMVGEKKKPKEIVETLISFCEILINF